MQYCGYVWKHQIKMLTEISEIPENCGYSIHIPVCFVTLIPIR